MKGDFSRLSFRRDKHTAGVLHQQGRVWIDADWNEDVQTRLDLAERETVDVIGLCGVPKPGTAFALSANAAAPGDFFISTGPGAEGRCYVDGILCELRDPAGGHVTYSNQPDYLDPAPVSLPAGDTPLDALVYVETWRRLVTYLEDPDIREIALNGPDTATRLRTVVQVKVKTLPPGTPMTDCAAAMRLVTDGDGTLTTLPPVDDQPPDPCRIPDPGAYTGRENHLYRVEIHSSAGTAETMPRTPLGQTEVIAQRRVAFAETSMVRSAALIPARFKWSKNNAADAVQVLSVSQDRRTVTVQSLGRDVATALVDGNIIEICDDRSELGPACGHLTTIAGNPDPDRLTIALSDPLPAEFVLPTTDPNASSTASPLSPPFAPANRHATLRRWDGVGNVATAFDQQLTPDMDLGDGVHIQFGGSDFRPGDYWQFIARSVDGSVEKLTNAKPAGIVRHRCPLALVRWQNSHIDLATLITDSRQAPANQRDMIAAIIRHLRALRVPKIDRAMLLEAATAAGASKHELAEIAKYADQHASDAPAMTFRVVKDCRSPFVPLTDEQDDDAGVHIVRVGRFDAKQEVYPLLNDSVVSVEDIVNGIGVWFDGPVDPHTISRPTCYVDVEVPVGTISPPPPPPTTTIFLVQGPTAQTAVARPTGPTGHTEPLGPTGLAQPIGAPEVLAPMDVSAARGDAAATAGGASGLTVTRDAAPFNLARAAPAFTAIGATFIPIGATFTPIGATATFGGTGPTGSTGPTGPTGATGATAEHGELGALAYQRITLGAKLAVDGNQVTWLPYGGLPELERFAARTLPGDRGMLTRLHLRGDVIWSADDTLFLDGDAFGRPNPNDRSQTLLRYPTGDGKRGGDFEMWFWVKPAAKPSVVYVVNLEGHVLEAYPLDANGPVLPARAIGGANDTTLVAPMGVAVDAAGNIYVSDDKLGAVVQFAPGASGSAAHVAQTAQGAVINPRGVAVDGAGNVYVADGPINNFGRIRVFAAGALGANPSRTITGPSTSLLQPTGVVVAPDGTIYATTTNSPTVGSGGKILAFAPGADGDAPARIVDDTTGRFGLSGIALDSAGRLYVAAEPIQNTAFTGAVLVYASATSTLIGTIIGSATMLFAPFGVAVDAGGIYVSNVNRTITVHPFDQFGNVAPLRTIVAIPPNLSFPRFVAIGP